MLFGRNKKNDEDFFLSGILNSLDAELVVVRGEDCEVAFANDAAQRGFTHAAELGDLCEEAISARFENFCARCPHNGDAAPQSLPYTVDVTDKNGFVFELTCNSITWMDGQDATALFFRDVTDIRNTQNKLFHLAYIDQLTLVPNRTKFKEDFEAAIPGIENGSLKGVLALFDLDNFKAINDNYGHNTGDIMLRRLTEYLSSISEFKDHLYRLGGDEFVLFYTFPADQFEKDHDLMIHYTKILQEAFVSYTLPTIEISCTLSMGIALFPQHGNTYSELLRKADIALYQAKNAGRNTLVLFKGEYDSAKKFKDLYINFQPVLTASGGTFGYELVDTSSHPQTSSTSVTLSDVDRTLDALGPSDMLGDAQYFIAYTNQLLNPSVLNNLPKEKFVVQVPLNGPVPPALLSKYKELHAYGYSLAMDGATPEMLSPPLLDIFNYCKFASNVDGATIKRVIAANPRIRFIAANVNTPDAFAAAKAQGFKLFQGFFFSQPVVVTKTKDIDPLKVNYLRLIKLTSTDDYVNFQEISSVISSDVALSYKLLRLLNSAAVGLRNPISSIEMAVAYLGEENLKKWIALLALRGIASDKPLELVRISLIRAHFGELLAPYFTPRRDDRHVFLVGLFSLLHIALEKTQAELFEEIPVADEIRLSLIGDSGPHSDLVKFFSNYEYSNWDDVSTFVKQNKLSDKLINDKYIAAVKWYNDLADT